MKGSDPDQTCGQDPDSNGAKFQDLEPNYNVFGSTSLGENKNWAKQVVFRGGNMIYPRGEKLAFCKI